MYWTDGAMLARYWSGFRSDFEVNLRLRWGLFSLRFLLPCFGFSGFFGLFVALGLAFFQVFSRIEPESREKTTGKLSKRSQL